MVEVVSRAAGNGDRSENGDYIYGRKRLREIDRELNRLAKRMKDAQVVDPRRQPDKQRVFFGATVTVADEDDRESAYTLVGVDEADAAAGRISWHTPIAKSEEHTSELQSLMRISYAVFCLKKKKKTKLQHDK